MSRFFLGARIDAHDRRHVDRRRQVVDDRIEHRLNALFLNAEPQMTTTKGASSSRTDLMTRLRRAALISSSLMGAPLRYFSSSLSSCSLTFSISFSRYCCASAIISAGISDTS
jgi:hypothetical protein